MDLVESCISKVDMAKVYKRVIEYTPIEFGTAIEKYMNKNNVPDAWRNPEFHIRKIEDGPITINGENYMVSKVYFGTLGLAVRNLISEEALIYMKPLCENVNFKKLSQGNRDKVEAEYQSRFVLALYNYYKQVRHQEKVQSGEIDKKPTKTNYESKEAYIASCIKSKLIMVYIDESKRLSSI